MLVVSLAGVRILTIHLDLDSLHFWLCFCWLAVCLFVPVLFVNDRKAKGDFLLKLGPICSCPG